MLTLGVIYVHLALVPHPSSSSFGVGGLVVKSCLTCNPMDYSLSVSSVYGIFPWQEYWSGLPFPSPGDLPDPGIKPMSPALQADSLVLCTCKTGKHSMVILIRCDVFLWW